MDVDGYVVNEPTVVHECIDGEVLVIHNHTGAYYSLRGTAAAIWQSLVAGHAPAVIAAHLSDDATTAEQVASDLAVFLDRLLSDGLVRPGPASASGDPLVDGPVPYVSPVVEAFTDMQDLLLLDPIHEVGDAGWPVRPTS